MTHPRPLSPAAQAVLDAFVEPFRVIARPMAAAAIRALANLAYEDYEGRKFLYVPEVLDIAAELDSGAPQPTPTETTNEHA